MPHGFDFPNGKSRREGMLEYEELTGRIINACMQVHKNLGMVFLNQFIRRL